MKAKRLPLHFRTNAIFKRMFEVEVENQNFSTMTTCSDGLLNWLRDVKIQNAESVCSDLFESYRHVLTVDQFVNCDKVQSALKKTLNTISVKRLETAIYNYKQQSKDNSQSVSATAEDTDTDPLFETERSAPLSELQAQLAAEHLSIELCIRLKCDEPLSTISLAGQSPTKDQDYKYHFCGAASEKIGQAVEAHQQRAKRLQMLVGGRLSSDDKEDFVEPVQTITTPRCNKNAKKKATPNDDTDRKLQFNPQCTVRFFQRYRHEDYWLLPTVEEMAAKAVVALRAEPAEPTTWECRQCRQRNYAEFSFCKDCNGFRNRRREYAKNERLRVRRERVVSGADTLTWQCEQCRELNCESDTRCAECNSWRKDHSWLSEQLSQRVNFGDRLTGEHTSSSYWPWPTTLHNPLNAYSEYSTYPDYSQQQHTNNSTNSTALNTSTLLRHRSFLTNTRSVRTGTSHYSFNKRGSVAEPISLCGASPSSGRINNSGSVDSGDEHYIGAHYGEGCTDNRLRGPLSEISSDDSEHLVSDCSDSGDSTVDDEEWLDLATWLTDSINSNDHCDDGGPYSDSTNTTDAIDNSPHRKRTRLNNSSELKAHRDRHSLTADTVTAQHQQHDCWVTDSQEHFVPQLSLVRVPDPHNAADGSRFQNLAVSQASSRQNAPASGGTKYRGRDDTSRSLSISNNQTNHDDEHRNVRSVSDAPSPVVLRRKRKRNCLVIVSDSDSSDRSDDDSFAYGLV